MYSRDAIAEAALRLKSDDEKALFRKAMALEGLGRNDEVGCVTLHGTPQRFCKCLTGTTGLYRLVYACVGFRMWFAL